MIYDNLIIQENKNIFKNNFKFIEFKIELKWSKMPYFFKVYSFFKNIFYKFSFILKNERYN